jgi:hypothetical protein
LESVGVGVHDRILGGLSAGGDEFRIRTALRRLIAPSSTFSCNLGEPRAGAALRRENLCNCG